MSKRSELAAQWRAIVHEQQNSGLPVARFCRSRGVPESSFFAWRRRLRQGRVIRSSPTFIEVKAKAHRQTSAAQGVAAAEPSSPIELLLPGGQCLRVPSGFDRQVLLDLLGALESL